MKERYIAHIDMDAFFASVEERDEPAYRGKPIVIGSDPKGGEGRGVVSTCSYEARKYGIHSAMPISIAYRKCPTAIFLRGRMSAYAEISDEIFEILERFTPHVAPLSIDEAFFDITGSAYLFGGPLETCRLVKKTIKQELGLTSSIGLAPNMMTAKIASDLKKPDGLVVVSEKNLLKFLHPLPIGKLWGIGEKSKRIFTGIGIRTVGDLAGLKENEARAIFGSNGHHAWLLANGIDTRIVEADDTVKSISNEYTFDKDTANKNDMHDALMYLSEKVSRRTRRSALFGKTITLKIRFSDFKTYTRSITLEHATNFADEIYCEIIKKLNEFDLKDKKVRLLGVKLSNFTTGSWQSDIFKGDITKRVKKEQLHKAIDSIKDRFGDKAIHRR